MSQRTPKRCDGTTSLFYALGNYRRQQVIRLACSGLRDVGELAEEIAKKECELDEEEYDSQARKRVYISLIQSHLPQLDEWGFVEYDDDRKEVEPTRKAKVSRWFMKSARLHP